MAVEQPARERFGKTIFLSLLVPGLGHFMAGRRAQGLAWFVLCQAMLFGGFYLAGNTQKDFGQPFSLFGTPVCFLLAPEMGNFIGSQAAAAFLESVELGGSYPEPLPWRHLGYALSGASGILAFFLAAHAAGCQASSRRRVAGMPDPLHPGHAALANLLAPGLGHRLQGRHFKAVLYSGCILLLFLVGMSLGDFADFNRQRHPYYWIGQMCLGLPGWIATVLSPMLRFERVLPYQDAGLLFTTSAGMFNIIAALDAYQRVEEDWEESAAATSTEVSA